jgi:hypothetical protein
MLNHMTTEEITIRPAYFDDQFALTQLAALDSADRVPPYPILLAEVDGQARVALSLADGSVIADPFHPTEALLALLHRHAKTLEPRRSGWYAFRLSTWLRRGARRGLPAGARLA